MCKIRCSGLVKPDASIRDNNVNHQLIDDGVAESGTDIAQCEGLHHSTVNELLRLTLLEPAIVQSIFAGQQPRCMSLRWFQVNPLPANWVAQREIVARFDV